MVESCDCVNNGLRIWFGEERPSLAVDHRIQRASLAPGDDREAAGLGFQGDNAEVLDLREDQHPGASVQRAELGVGNVPEEFDIRVSGGPPSEHRER